MQLVYVVMWAGITILGFGSQTAHLKTRVVKRIASPWLLKSVFSLGVASIGIVLAVVARVQAKCMFSLWGVYAALLWAPGTVLLLFATHCIGVGLTTGLVTASASLTAFVSGTLVLGDVLPKPDLAILGIVVLLIGVGGLAGTAIRGEQHRRAVRGIDASLRSTLSASASSRFSRQLLPHRPSLLAQEFTRDSGDFSQGNTRQPSLLVQSSTQTEPVSRVLLGDPTTAESIRAVEVVVGGETSGIDLIGMLSAIFAGIFYGCQGFFLVHGEEIANGISMMFTQLPIMGVLGVTLSLIASEGPCMCRSMTRVTTMIACLSAMLGGTFFGVGFIGQMYVLNYFGNAVGMPLTQANLVISGFWSVVVFREVEGNFLIVAFATSALLVLIGVAILAVCK